MIMAEHADNGDGVFVYTGGEQVVPDDVTHVIVDKSVKIIRRYAFCQRHLLSSIEMHDGIEIIEDYAFYYCPDLKGIKLLGVRVVGKYAFTNTGLKDVEFGDKLETVGYAAFQRCRSLKSVEMPTVRDIDANAFKWCYRLTDVEMPDIERIGNFAFLDCPLDCIIAMPEVERIGQQAFFNCTRLSRIAIPLKEGIIDGDDVFDECDLSTVDVVGGIHKTISSLHLESWRNEMSEGINRINRVLEDTPANEKTRVIRQWIESVLERLNHFKTEHKALLKEAMTLFELALWKAKLLDEKEEDHFLGGKQASKRAKIDDETARTELRITSRASDVIKNVLSFLVLE